MSRSHSAPVPQSGPVRRGFGAPRFAVRTRPAVTPSSVSR